MKLKKILAAIAACAMSAAMLGMVVSAEGTVADDDVIDTDGDDDIIDDGDDGDDIVDDGNDDDNGDDDEGPAPVVDNPVNNPQTGNSPIALAVIPVALAAAAVVAKKAK